MARPAKSMDKQYDTQLICSNCGSDELYQDNRRGETTCTQCGYVIKGHEIDKGPEWRAFTAEERDARARTGAPMRLSIPDKGLATSMGWKIKDASGRSITGSRRAAIYRMRKWHLRTIIHDSVRRNLILAMKEMDRLGSQLGVPRETRETAALIYRKALRKRLVRGKSIDGIVAASIYIACRIHRIPRQLDEIVSEAKVNIRTLGQGVRHLIRELDVHIPLPSANDLIPRISSELGIQGNTIYKAIEIIKKAKDAYLTAGKDPGGIVAAALYIAGIIEDDRRTQREIAESCHVTEVTVRNRYKEMIRKLDIDPLE